MSWEITLDNLPYSFSSDDLPILIHGEKHSGSSLFTFTLLAHLYKQGHPLLFLFNENYAKEAFIQQTQCENNLLIIEKDVDLIGAEAYQVLGLAHKDVVLLPNILSSLPDIKDRIVLLTDIDQLSEIVISSLTNHQLTLYSGDLNMCSSKELLLQLKYNAKIFFSPLTNDFRLTLPHLEKYQGYFLGRISQGKIHLKPTDHAQM